MGWLLNCHNMPTKLIKLQEFYIWSNWVPCFTVARIWLGYWDLELLVTWIESQTPKMRHMNCQCTMSIPTKNFISTRKYHKLTGFCSFICKMQFSHVDCVSADLYMQYMHNMHDVSFHMLTVFQLNLSHTPHSPHSDDNQGMIAFHVT